MAAQVWNGSVSHLVVDGSLMKLREVLSQINNNMRTDNNQQQQNNNDHLVQKTTQIDDIIQNNRQGRQQQQQHQEDNGKLHQETDVDNASQQRKERILGLNTAKNNSSNRSWIDAWSAKLLIIFITSALTVILVRYLQEDSIDVALPV